MRDDEEQGKRVPFVFLSYARKDYTHVLRLKEDLRLRGIAVWLDKEALRAGTSDWEEALRTAIKAASALILVASPDARRSRHVKDEIRVAEMYQLPIYPLWISGDQWIDAIPLGMGSTQHIDARGASYGEAIDQLVQVLKYMEDARSLSSSAEAQMLLPLFKPRNPYKGLAAFRAQDANDFFGRTRFIQLLLQFLQRTFEEERSDPTYPRLMMLVGASGSGKSSVMMAGLFPLLQQGALADSQHWRYFQSMTPGPHPLEALALTIAEHIPTRNALRVYHDLLAEDTLCSLHLLVKEAVGQSSTKAILFVDQFEELFTQTQDEKERRLFLDLLLAAATEVQGPLVVLIALRADFYDQLLRYLDIGQLVKKHVIDILPLTPQEMREVIEKPAQLPDVQLAFEEDLVGDLLFDIRGQSGALPLLQFTLDRLFEQRQERLLTTRVYERMGGVRGALAQQAEQTYSALPNQRQRELARALFLRLIDPGTMEQDATRRRIALTELVVIDPEETVQLTEVMMAFIEARLLVTATVNDISTLEVSHEALLQAWTRLRDWFHEARDDIRIQQTISNDAMNWRRHGQPSDWLYQNSRLIEALRWRANNLPSRDEEDFLQASVRANERMQQEERQRRQRYTRRTIILGGIASIGGMILGTGILANWWQKNPLLLYKSLSSVWRTLPYSYTIHNATVYSVAWSPDGQYIASADDNGIVQIWDSHTGDSLFSPYSKHTSYVMSVVWSPDSQHIASAGGDGTVRVWNMSTQTTLLIYEEHTGAIGQVAWSPNGQRIASAGEDGTVRVWNASTGATFCVYRKHAASVWRVAWSPDGQRIASAGDDRTMQVWNASTGTPLLAYSRHTATVESVTWSADGTRIASAGDDKTVQGWNTDTGALLLTWIRHTDVVESVAWSPDGHHIASAGDDKIVWIWSSDTGSTLLVYDKHEAPVESLAWLRGGQRIASGGGDGVRDWDPMTGLLLLPYRKHTASVNGVAWSPDGKYMASAGGDNVVRVWEADQGTTSYIYEGHTDVVRSVAWSPDGMRIGSAGEDETVQIWSPFHKKCLRVYREHKAGVESVAWSPDNQRIASAGGDRKVHIWDPDTGATLLHYDQHSDSVSTAIWSPDGTRIASAGDDQTVQGWDPMTGVRLCLHLGHNGFVHCVAWSSDGTHIVSGGRDKTAQVWKATTGKTIYVYHGHAETVLAVAWSPDGLCIASAGNDKTVQLWSIQP